MKRRSAYVDFEVRFPSTRRRTDSPKLHGRFHGGARCRANAERAVSVRFASAPLHLSDAIGRTVAARYLGHETERRRGNSGTVPVDRNADSVDLRFGAVS